MYKLRHIQAKLQLMAQHFKIILITGARQVGKTTLLKHTFPDTKIVTFDPQEDVHGARSNPHLFFKSFPSPLILDEVQYVPELFPLLKRLVDESPAPGQYFMTGSHNFSMLKKVAESLAGRVGILDLTPMTTFEQNNTFSFDANGQTTPKLWLEHYLQDPLQLTHHFKGVTEESLVHTLWRGGMPHTLTLPASLLTDFFRSYVQTYIERDIRTMIEVDNIVKFRQFVATTAANTGQEVNNAHLGRKIDTTPKTARSWLNLMMQTYQWHEILAYSRNKIKRAVSSKTKGYFTDTGLACYLMNISDPHQILTHDARGFLFETLVINTIQSMCSSLPYRPSFFFWRTTDKTEVDLVLEMNGALYPIEIKMKSVLSKHDTSGLKAFRTHHEKTQPVKTALIIYTGSECYWFDENTIALPWNALCR